MRLTAFLRLGVAQLSTCMATSVSKQILLGTEEYFLPPAKAWSLDTWCGSNNATEEYTPLTVVDLNDTVSLETVSTVLQQYAAADDVWTPSFAEGTNTLQVYFGCRF